MKDKSIYDTLSDNGVYICGQIVNAWERDLIPKSFLTALLMFINGRRILPININQLKYKVQLKISFNALVEDITHLSLEI